MRNPIACCSIVLGIIFCLLAPVSATIKLPALVSDGMVLQRDIALPVWGWAQPGAAVTVTFQDKTYQAVTGQDGKWLLKLDKQAAGGPYEMQIKGDGSVLTIRNILVGDVWTCSGQSNMVFDFNNSRANALYAKDRETSANDQIRQILVARGSSAVPAADFKTTGWKAASPATLSAFSAAAYFFARNINDKYRIPVGLINTSFGGTRVEAWTSEEALAAFPQFKNDIALLKDTAQVNAKIRAYQQRITDWHSKNKTEDKGYANGKAIWAESGLDDSQWKTTNLPALWDKYGYPNTFGVFWFRKEIEVPASMAGRNAVLKLGSIDDEDECFVNGVKVGGYANRTKPREHTVPGNLLKAGKNLVAVKVINYYDQGGMAGDQPMMLVAGDQQVSLNGGWKYQQGYVAGRLPGVYNPQDLASSLFNGMVAPLIPYAIKGAIWYQGENNVATAWHYRKLFPNMISDWRSRWQQGNFPFIFQQLVNLRAEQPQPSESQWAELREAQLMTLTASPNTAMAVGIDIGEANDIHPVNKKDVGYRLSLGARKLAYGEKKLVSAGPLYTGMKVQGDKIIISFANEGSSLVAKDGKALRYFAIAGEDKKFVWANAAIKGNTVEVSAKEVARPVAVRYAWADNPETANLFNKEGLPASPFRTDDWPGLTVPKL
jgi:sialate O-acetylesterase